MTKKSMFIFSGLMIFISLNGLYGKDIGMGFIYFYGTTYLYRDVKSFDKDDGKKRLDLKHFYFYSEGGFENGRDDIHHILVYSKQNNIDFMSITDTNKNKRDIWQSFTYNGYDKAKKSHVYLLKYQLPVSQNSVSIISNSYIALGSKKDTYFTYLIAFESSRILIDKVNENNKQVLVKKEVENIPTLVNNLKKEAINYYNKIQKTALTNNFVSKRYIQIFNEYVRQAQNMGLKNANQKDLYFLYRYINQTIAIPKNQVYNFKVVGNEMVFCHDNGAERFFDINNNGSKMKLREYFEVGASKKDDWVSITEYDANKPLQIISTQIYRYTYINGKKCYIITKEHEAEIKPNDFNGDGNYVLALEAVRKQLPKEYTVFNGVVLGWVYED